MATQTTAIQGKSDALAVRLRPNHSLAFPWRDPHSVPQQQLAEFIASLTEACANNPDNSNMYTCLGIAHAINYDVYRSFDALEEARRIEPGNFFAQFKYAELFFRLRLMDRAEEETLAALELAANNWELSLARRQLAEIRGLKRKGLTGPLWTKSLMVPAIGFLLFLGGAFSLYLVWK
jgi:tetratricopeptide (TPR) repeat protein